ncbi:MAG: hypothetical protein VZR53_05055 [Prevotella sp.]|jgi:hypothetical protein|nr:hypothetical protein [Prevotella sp.]
MKIESVKQWSTEKISQYILYVLVGLIVLIFILFYLIGFDLPFLDNPAFNAPLFTDGVIALMWLMLIFAIGLVIWSFVKSYRSQTKVDQIVNGIPATKISYVVWGVTFVLMVLTFLFTPTSPVIVNGKLFQEWFSLKLSGMFVYTSILLLVIAIATVVFGSTRYIRRNTHQDVHKA